MIIVSKTCGTTNSYRNWYSNMSFNNGLLCYILEFEGFPGNTGMRGSITFTKNCWSRKSTWTKLN